MTVPTEPSTSPANVCQILAIETCNQTCSVALWRNGVMIQELERQPRMHAQLVLPMVQAVLKQAACDLRDIDAVAFGAGPGSFTGLRIAAAVTQGLAFGAELPVIPISTLAALAYKHAQVGQTVMAGFDARMGEVYYGVYVQQPLGAMPNHLVNDAVARPAEVALIDGDFVGFGSAWEAHAEALTSRLGAPEQIQADAEPDAAAVAQLAALEWQAGQGGQPVIAAQPVYLRHNVAKKSTKIRG